MKARMLSQAGYTLIEVLVGMLIFVLGMMALAQMQGNLTKSSADSNARTVALNISEETVERLRTFSQVTASNDVAAFNNIVSGTATVSRGGLDYTVTSAVTDYYYHSDGTFQTTKPDPDIINANLKRLDLTVSWGAPQSFQVDQNTATSDLGTGSVTVTDLISSFTIASGAKSVLNGVGDSLYAPPVNYNPGANPDIISIELGQNKFKESTPPLPDIIRADELVETRFDVVTYSQISEEATFLRREEFRALSCQCTLRIPDADGEGGLRPTIWEGYEYTEAEFISKPFGESADNLQSDFCSLCCRDHHDGGTSSDPETLDDSNDPGRSRYSPFRSTSDYHTEGALAGDHKHYNRNRQGELVLAESDGDVYVEACRMVRKNGFFRIAQDLRQEGLNAFPADYLDQESEVSEYSGYVTTAVSAYEDATEDGYELLANPPSLVEPQNLDTLAGETALIFPASTPDAENRTTLPTLTGATSQQLRSRGIYIDYMSDVLRDRIICLEAALLIGGTGADCDVPNVGSALEIIPFYDVQLTWLSRWTESPDNTPVDVSNEPIESDNTHDRGIAGKVADGESTINSEIHKGNLGLTGTDPIDPRYSSELTSYNLYALAGEYIQPPPDGYFVSGTITSGVPGVRAADVTVTGSNTACNRSNDGYNCFIETGANNPRIEIANYAKAGFTLYACSTTMTIHGQGHVADNGVGNWTRFNMPAGTLDSGDIVIKQDSC